MNEENEPLWELLRAIPGALLVVGSRGEIQWVNQQAAQLWCCAPEVLRGRSLAQLWRPKFQAVVVEALDELFASRLQVPRLGPLESSRVDGSALFVELAISSAWLSGADVALVSLHDVTSLVDAQLRERAEAAVLTSQMTREQLASIVACSPCIFFFVDLHGIIQFVNQEELRQYEGILGADVFSFLSGDEQRRVRSIFARVIEAKVSESYELVAPGATKQAQYSCRMSPVLQGGEVTGVVIFAQDITAQRQLEAQLATSERMASVGLLAAGVAHEINNPLTSIIANLDLAFEVLSEAWSCDWLQLQHWVSEASDAAGRVRAIVRDLRLFSRADEEERRPVRLENILSSTLRLAQNEIRHRARLVTRYEPAPLVDANESRLGQVFLNLIINAAQSIEEGHAASNELRVSISTTSTGEALVEISDTGRGMSLDQQNRIFEPFFTTKPAGMGTGLGLAICSRIIGIFDGRIEVESALGEGSSFRVYLPPSDRPRIPTPSYSSPMHTSLLGSL